MPLGAVATESSSGEYINHCVSIRVRATGEGQLLMSVFSIDDVLWKKLVPFQLQTLNRIVPTRIVNFRSQRMSFELKTVNPNEIFKINRIIIFAKPSATSYPG
jgi:hypothetical protein